MLVIKVVNFVSDVLVKGDRIMTYSRLKKLQEVFESEKRIAVCRYGDDGYSQIGTIDEYTDFEEIDRLIDIPGNDFFIQEGDFTDCTKEINFI
jgi:hypothetical protein